MCCSRLTGPQILTTSCCLSLFSSFLSVVSFTLAVCRPNALPQGVDVSAVGSDEVKRLSCYLAPRYHFVSSSFSPEAAAAAAADSKQYGLDVHWQRTPFAHSHPPFPRAHLTRIISLARMNSPSKQKARLPCCLQTFRTLTIASLCLTKKTTTTTTVIVRSEHRSSVCVRSGQL